MPLANELLEIRPWCMLTLIGRGGLAGPGHAVQVRCDAPVVRLRLTLGILVLVIVPSIQMLEDDVDEAAIVPSFVLAAGECHGTYLLAQKLQIVEDNT